MDFVPVYQFYPLFYYMREKKYKKVKNIYSNINPLKKWEFASNEKLDIWYRW